MSLRRHILLLAGVPLLIVLPVTLDLTYRNFNPSILYVLPLLLYSLLGRKHNAYRLAGLLVLLSFACYFAKYIDSDEPVYLSYRLLNRVFVAIGMVFAVVALQRLSFGNAADPSYPEHISYDPDQHTFEQVLSLVRVFLAASVSFGMAAALFLADLLAPGQLNLAILYSMPLLTATFIKSRKWLWIMSLGLIVLAVLGWVFGQPPTVDPTLIRRLLMNRILAVGTLVATTLILHVWFGRTQLSPEMAESDLHPGGTNR